MKKNFLFLFSLATSLSFSQGPGACGQFSKLKPLDGTGSLGESYNNSACGLNYVQSSVLTETRSQQWGFNANGTGLPTTCAIAGLPSCMIVDKAFVWYVVSYQEATLPSTTVTITNPNNVTSNVATTMIGSGPSKCWAETGTGVFRADVTSSISGNGNYTIDIQGLQNKNWEVDGVTLLIIYKNSAATYYGTMIIDDGNMTGNWGLSSQTMMNVNACAASTSANGFNIVSDMQSNVNSGIHPATINGFTNNFPNTFWSFDQSNTAVTSGQTTAQFAENGNNADCYTWCVMGLYFQTAACTTCVAQSQTTLTLTATTTNASCANANGTASVTASGGTTPYTYIWNPSGQTTQTATGLAPGTYTVTVTDNTGCGVGTATVQVTGTPVYPITTSTSPVLCNGGTTGSATVTPSGGVTPYTYQWNPSGQTTQTATGLGAGTYTIIVTDNTNCQATATVTITQPTALTLSTAATPTQCSNSTNGIASVIVSGGTSGYTYLWTPSGQTTSNATGLSPNTYTVTVTDANGCTATASVTVTSPPPLGGTSSVIPVTCNGGSNGSGQISVSGGTPTYSYQWLPNGGTNASATGLTAGTYTIIVTDVNGCTTAPTIVITQPPPITSSFNVTNVSCNGGSNGSATVSGSGGNGTPYGYQWNTIPPVFNATHTGLTAGTYTVTINDVSGCTQTATVTVTQPPVPVDTFTITGVFCPGDSMAVLHAQPGLGNYQWYNDTTPIAGANSDSLVIYNTSNFVPYTVTFMLNGCVRKTTLKVISEPINKYIPQSTTNVFSPNGDGKNDFYYPYYDLFYGPASIAYMLESYDVKIFNRWGNLVFESSDYRSPWDGKYNGKKADEGIYYWIATFKPRCAADPNPVVYKGFVHLMR